MGVEFRLIAPPPALAQWQQVLSCFEQAGSYYRVSASDNDAQVAYAWAQPLRAKWPDDFMVALEAQGIYLLFHTSVKQSIIQQLTNCLQAAGVAGIFEEL